jgi:hypothetical protein
VNSATIQPLGAAFSICLSLTAHAYDAPPQRGVSVCAADKNCSWSKPQARAGLGAAAKPSGQAATSASNEKHRTTRTAKEAWDGGAGNLPSYLKGSRSSSGNEAVAVLVPDKVTGALLPGLRAGDILAAELEQSIKASPSVPTPIRARITAGRFIGAVVLGAATLDRELKRVLLSFDHLRLSGSDTGYQLKATGLALNGQVGLEGEHHAEEGSYLLAELGAATAAGYADATTSRSPSILGGYQTEPSAANAVKQGAVQALSKTADRFAERVRSAPEYTEIEGGRAIQIIIETAPMEVQ